MKIFRKISLLLAAIILFSVNSFAQPDNVIKVNLLSPFVKSGSFFYERALNDEMSLVGGFFFTAWSPGEDVTLGGFGGTLEFRYYLSESAAPSGAFIAPFGRFQKFSITEGIGVDESEANMTSTGGGLLVGIQRLFKERITLEGFIGPAYYMGDTELVSGTSITEIGAFDGFTVRFGVTVGVAF
jgi:hypothetical protein